MIEAMAKTGLLGSIGAALTATCCVLPVALMLLGVGGSWLGVFGPLAAASLYVAAASAVVVSCAWVLAVWRRVPRRTYAFLAAGSVLTMTAWAVILNEVAINDYLIEMM
jgi:mercuric ion transport protein